MRTQVLATALVVAVSTITAPQHPEFEAATVKRRTEPGGGSWGRQPGGRFTAQGITLKDLIVVAYNVQPDQIVGGPAWLDTERWDVVAAGAPGTPDDVLVALQGLLADRFAMTVRRSQQERPIYALTLARNDGRLGPQMKPGVDCAAMRTEARRTGAQPPPSVRELCAVEGRIGSMRVAGEPLSQFAAMLSTRVQRPVIDHTGLSGTWDLTVTYAPDPAQMAALPPDSPIAITYDPNGPSLFTAVQEQLGLKLEPTRAPIDVLVIDHAEFPKEN